MRRIFWLYLVIILAAIVVVVLISRSDGETAYKAPSVSTPIRSDVTTLVQTRLHQFGYTITIDGVYGKQTRRVVSLWQRANGLTVDGIAGVETLKTLGPLNFATANAPAVRTSPPAAPTTPVGTTDVEQIIRDTWPDDSEDWAVRIATRESSLQPNVRNSCCWGLFQLFWTIHRGWMADYGVTSPEQLYDPRTNTEMALVLYQRNGPSPWNL